MTREEPALSDRAWLGVMLGITLLMLGILDVLMGVIWWR